MGLPQLDFRVPEATWFKSALGKLGAMPGVSATGALAWPYKIAVVAVMALVASGTLVTFGSAGAETPSSSEVAALPGSDEASPSVEGQVLPPSNALLNGADLLSTLNLADYSPGDTTLSLSDDDDDSDDDGDDEEKKKADAKKKQAAAKPTPTSSAKPTTSPTTSAPEPTPTKTTAPPPPPSPSPEPSPSPTKTCKWEGDGLLKKWVCS